MPFYVQYGHVMADRACSMSEASVKAAGPDSNATENLKLTAVQRAEDIHCFVLSERKRPAPWVSRKICQH